MIRAILRSNQNKLIITLSDDLVGKLIEVIAFEIKKTGAIVSSGDSKSQTFSNGGIIV